jgi:F0F1-type ATP synthase assembly protein I
MLRRGEGGEGQRSSGWVDLALQTSLTLALSVLLLGWAGRALDGWLGTNPWFTIIGALWGAAGGTVWVVIRVKQYADKNEQSQSPQGRNGNKP